MAQPTPAIEYRLSANRMVLDRSNKSPARNRCGCRSTYIVGNSNIPALHPDGKQVRRIWSRINPARIREREQFGDLIKPINSVWCNDHRETSNIWERAVVTRIYAVAVDFQAVPESLWPRYHSREREPNTVGWSIDLESVELLCERITSACQQCIRHFFRKKF